MEKNLVDASVTLVDWVTTDARHTGQSACQQIRVQGAVLELVQSVDDKWFALTVQGFASHGASAGEEQDVFAFWKRVVSFLTK